MQSTRILALIFFLVTFGFLVSASPVQTSDLIARGNCSDCGHQQDTIISALLDLQIKLKVVLDLLVKTHATGGSPADGVSQIIVLINACVDIIAKVDIDISGVLGDKKHQIAELCASILVSIVVCLSAFPLTIINLLLYVQLDICLNAFVLIIGKVCVGLITVIASLCTHVDLFVSLKLVLTVATLGLLSL